MLSLILRIVRGAAFAFFQSSNEQYSIADAVLELDGHEDMPPALKKDHAGILLGDAGVVLALLGEISGAVYSHSVGTLIAAVGA